MAAKQLSVGELAAAVVAGDEELRDSLKGLVSDIIGHMRYTMKHGEASAKIQLAKAITPQLLTAINKVDQEQSREAEREAYARMMSSLRGEHEETAPIVDRH